MRRIPHRADNAFEKILYEWLKQSDIWLPPSVRDRIMAVIIEACQGLRGLGYGRGVSWGLVEEGGVNRETAPYRADRRLYLTADKQRVVEHDSPDAAFLLAGKGGEIPMEDAKRFGLVEALPREKGKTIVIKLVDRLWPLYWDHVPHDKLPDKLPGVVLIMRQLFEYQPLNEFSEEGYQCIKEHEQGLFEGRKQDLDGMSEGKIPKRGRTPIPEKDQERRRQNEVVHRQPKGRLSENDKKLYELIGKDEFQARTNDELEKSYRRKAETKLYRQYPKHAQGFRSAVKRIRKHHGLLTSQEIRKKRST